MVGNEKYNKIIDDSIEHFLDRIRKTIETKQYKRKRRARYSFEIFKPGNDEYYEYKFLKEDSNGISEIWLIRFYFSFFKKTA